MSRLALMATKLFLSLHLSLFFQFSSIQASVIKPGRILPDCFKQAFVDEISELTPAAYKIERELKYSEIEFSKKLNLDNATTEVHFVGLAGGRKGVFKPDLTNNEFSSSRHEVAVYELDKLLDLGLVPITVQRKMNGKLGSFQQFIDSTKSATERYGTHEALLVGNSVHPKSKNLNFLDYLIGNNDRRSENYLITRQKNEIAIDNGNSFQQYNTIETFVGPGRYAASIAEITPDAKVLIRLKNLSDQTIKERLKDYLNEYEIKGLLDRKYQLLDKLKTK